MTVLNPGNGKASRPRGHRGVARILACLASAAAAQAQSMDYDKLEDLFGEPVTTSATGLPQRVTEAPVDMTIVTADEIRRSGARDLPGILRHVAGIDILQWAADDADLSIRGYNQAYAARTLVLIDGRQVYGDWHGFVPWNALPVELGAIRQIEVVKGPNAALFGFNAVGGVINIITANPRYDDVNTASVRGGTQGMVDLSGVATLEIGRSSAVRLSGGWGSGNEFSTAIPPAMAGPPRGQNDRAEINALAALALTDNIELDLSAAHSHARRNDVYPAYMYDDEHFETNTLYAKLMADTGIGLIQLSGFKNWQSEKSTYNPAYGRLEFHNELSNIKLEDAIDLGIQHTVRLALEYRHNSETTTPFQGGKVFYDVLSASLMWHWRVSPALTLTAAGRLDHLNLARNGLVPSDYPLSNADWYRTIDTFSYNAGLVWRSDDANTFRLTAARGWKLPPLGDLGGIVFHVPPFGMTGVPGILPTAVDNYEINWERTFDFARARAALFYERSKDIESAAGGFIPIPGGVYLTSANIGNSEAAGGELTIGNSAASGWRWSFGYRAEFIDDHFIPMAARGIAFVDFMHTTPKHLVKANLGWSDERWEIDVYPAYQSHIWGLRPSLGATELVSVGDYANIDARVAYNVTDWATVAVSGQNLVQSPQRQTSGAPVERQVFVTLTVRN